MRTPGEFKTLKKAIMEAFESHPEIAALLQAKPFRGIMPTPSKAEIHCHWDQSMSITLTELVLTGEQVGPNHLRRIMAEVAPGARIVTVSVKRAATACVVRSTVTFAVPEEVPAASSF